MPFQIVRLGIDHQRCCAMVQYDDMEAAKEALLSVKGIRIKNSRKLMASFIVFTCCRNDNFLECTTTLVCMTLAITSG